MEKYARQALSEGIKAAEDLHVTDDCELLRVLNLHYNRSNHITVREKVLSLFLSLSLSLSLFKHTHLYLYFYLIMICFFFAFFIFTQTYIYI